MSSQEVMDAVGEAPAREDSPELAAAKKEMLGIKRGYGAGGLSVAYEADRKAVKEAFDALRGALTREYNRYLEMAAKHDRARHLMIDYGLEDPKLPKLEAPGQPATQMVMDLLRVVQRFRAHKATPSPKQQAAAQARQQAEDERRAQQAASAAADLERSGYGKAARQMKELSKAGRVTSV